MEYLRNVGIEAVKPDQHICRMVGPERLGLTDISPSPEQAEQVLKTVASEANVGPTYLDNILWIFAAKDYAAICTADPRCEICLVRTCHKNELD
jgi:thermostable 8-oxoguanine DNA glycosylase